MVPRTFRPMARARGNGIVYDNASNLACYGYFMAAQRNRFRREEQFRIAQEQFRIPQDDIMTVSHSSRRDYAGGAGIAFGTELPANLMDFTDDLLAVIFHALAMQHGELAVEHVPLAFFVSVKLVSRRAMSLMRNRLHAEYQAALHALAHRVSGTRIPCGAAIVLAVPSPADWDETWSIFQDNLVHAPNGLEVGGSFNYHSNFFTESVELEVADDKPREFLLLVENYWNKSTIYHLPLAPGEGMCDVSRLPNNLRSSMGHLDLIVSYDSVRQSSIGYYYRFVRVRVDTTMQEVFDAISFVEGWNMPAYNMCIGHEAQAWEIGPGSDVLVSIDLANEVQWRLVIDWPPLSIRVEPIAVQPPVIQEHTTTVSDMDDNEGNSDIDEHASGDLEDKSGGDNAQTTPGRLEI